MSTDLADCVRRNLNRYFRDLDGETPHAIHDMVIASVEPPMLEVVMKHAQGNQTLAAEILGMSRSTLRRKLAQYGMDNIS
jgi:Fis family transcriptional regulator